MSGGGVTADGPFKPLPESDLLCFKSTERVIGGQERAGLLWQCSNIRAGPSRVMECRALHVLFGQLLPRAPAARGSIKGTDAHGGIGFTKGCG
jgi:hypothetical protein